ncbi:MAG: diphthamide synthesis protein [Candidatus Pacearchaeota archaeon]
MKIYYSEIFKKAKFSQEIIFQLQKILPEKFFLAYTIQYKPLALKLKKLFKDHITGFSQVIGCSKIPKQLAVLLIGEGKFHALNLLNYADKVIVFNGESFNELGEQEREKIESENKVKFSKLLYANEIGILISTKPGQYNIQEALKIKNKLTELKKKSYFFFFDTLNYNDLYNFDIKFWLNTSCPGLEYDLKNVMNAKTFFQLLNDFY